MGKERAANNEDNMQWLAIGFFGFVHCKQSARISDFLESQASTLLDRFKLRKHLLEPELKEYQHESDEEPLPDEPPAESMPPETVEEPQAPEEPQSPKAVEPQAPEELQSPKSPKTPRP